MTFDSTHETGGDAPGEAEPEHHPREFSLAEKLRIVHEANTPGVTFCHVEKKYGLGRNVLAYWRRSYGGLTETLVADAMRASAADAGPELVALRMQVERLGRLLEQRTFELDLLRAQGEAP